MKHKDLDEALYNAKKAVLGALDANCSVKSVEINFNTGIVLVELNLDEKSYNKFINAPKK